VNIPGTFIISGIILLIGLFTKFSFIDPWQITLLFILSIILELMEFLLGAIVAKYFGASNRSAMLAVVGGIMGIIIGTSILPLIGTLAGLFAGAYSGVYIGEISSGKTAKESARSAFGACIGTLLSKFIKSASVVIIGLWFIKQIG
jgi:hypothetical protein